MASIQSPPPVASSRRAARLIGDALFTVAALGGVVCIALVALAFFFNVTLIMFKTGSMSPTIPAGSLAVVRVIPAAEIQVGDVVTVDRPGALPITHRVTSVTPAAPGAHGQTDAARTITMQGDANEVADPAPYTVTTVRIVLGSVPGLARVVVWFSNPAVLGALTFGSSVLVTWAFWPREPRESRAVSSRPRRHGRRPESRARHARRTAVFSLPLIVGALVIVQPPASVEASEVARVGSEESSATEQVVSGQHLTLISVGDPVAMMNLMPGEPVHWQIGVIITASEPGTVNISFSASGSAALGLQTSVAACAERWMSDACAGASDILAAEPVDLSGRTHQLAVMPSDQERWFRFSVWRAVDAGAVVNNEVHFAVHAEGAGDEIDITPGSGPELRPGPGTSPGTDSATDSGAALRFGSGGSIALSGVAPFIPLLAAGGSILLGLAIAGSARLRRRKSS